MHSAEFNDRIIRTSRFENSEQIDSSSTDQKNAQNSPPGVTSLPSHIPAVCGLVALNGEFRAQLGWTEGSAELPPAILPSGWPREQ
jgi:hypothetical protein